VFTFDIFANVVKFRNFLVLLVHLIEADFETVLNTFHVNLKKTMLQIIEICDRVALGNMNFRILTWHGQGPVVEDMPDVVNSLH